MNDEKLDALMQHWPEETRALAKAIMKLESPDGQVVWGEKQEVDPMSALNDAALSHFGQLQTEQDKKLRQQLDEELERLKTDATYFFEKIRGEPPTEIHRQILAVFESRKQSHVIARSPGVKYAEMRMPPKFVLIPPDRYRIVEKPDVSGHTLLAVEFNDPVPEGEVEINYSQKTYEPRAGRIDEIVEHSRGNNGALHRSQINRALRGLYVHSHKGRLMRRHGLKVSPIYGAVDVRVVERVKQE